MLSFIETPLFTKRVGEYLSDEEYRELQEGLASNPKLDPSFPVPVESESCDGHCLGGVSVAD